MSWLKKWKVSLTGTFATWSKPLLILPMCTDRTPQLGLLPTLGAAHVSRDPIPASLSCPTKAWDMGSHTGHEGFHQKLKTHEFPSRLLKFYPLSPLLTIVSPNHFFCSKNIPGAPPLLLKALTMKPTTSTPHGLPEPKDKKVFSEAWKKPKKVTSQLSIGIDSNNLREFHSIRIKRRGAFSSIPSVLAHQYFS